eukprot:2444022-Rhodomonas_salina.1
MCERCDAAGAAVSGPGGAGRRDEAVQGGAFLLLLVRAPRLCSPGARARAGLRGGVGRGAGAGSGWTRTRHRTPRSRTTSTGPPSSTPSPASPSSAPPPAPPPPHLPLPRVWNPGVGRYALGFSLWGNLAVVRWGMGGRGG